MWSILLLIAVVGLIDESLGTTTDSHIRSYQQYSDNLKTGEGNGRFTMTSGFEKSHPIDVTFHVRFSKQELNATFDYSPVRDQSPHYDKVSILSDATALFATKYTPRIHPAGCETYIYNPTRKGLAMATGGCLWFPASLHLIVMDPKKIGQLGPVIYKSENGIIVGRLTGPMGKYTFSLLPGEFRVGKCSVESPTGDGVSEFTSEWSVDRNGFPYVRKVQSTITLKGENVLATCWEYSEFEANPRFDPDLFTFSSLEACTGSRIIDQRPGATTKIYKNEPAVAAEKRLDSLADSVTVLPPRFPSRTQRPRVSTTFWIVIAANGALLAIIAGYAWRQRRQSAPRLPQS